MYQIDFSWRFPNRRPGIIDKIVTYAETYPDRIKALLILGCVLTATALENPKLYRLNNVKMPDDQAVGHGTERKDGGLVLPEGVSINFDSYNSNLEQS